MKKLRCPKCNYTITFDETKYQPGQTLVFQCKACGKEFGIRIKDSVQKDKNINDDSPNENVGSIVVIENRFHYKQVLPLRMGDNVIGRYMKGSKCNTPIETTDPSMDMNHCVITVMRDKNGKLKYVLRDGPSYTGTFVDNQILGDKEKRVIKNDTLFTIGATSIILKDANSG
ncbi:MAG: FHA domain-containing protein [Prevotella sp.]|nr:FHA domain-containing protein [Prevotella sp.]